MSDLEPVSADAHGVEYEQQLQRVVGLRAFAYQNPSVENLRETLPLLAAEEEKLRKISDPMTPSAVQPSAPAPTGTVGNKLGATTTKLVATVDIRMHPVPTAIYHLLDPQTHPLLTVTIENVGHDPRRVRVRAAIEGLSTESVKTIELARTGTPGSKTVINLLPTFHPRTLDLIRDVQRATVSVVVEDLDRKIEAHDTYSIVCLSRNSSFNAVRDPTGKLADFTRYYGAWVTPYDERVQECIRAAAELCTPRQIWGYQKEPATVTTQVRALFDALRNRGMTYVNSVIDYGAPAGYFTQRTRLPRESLESTSANCIDGTVLMASLLEGASLNPALVLVPGHAFVAWETWDNSNEWKYLETTLMGDASFDDAVHAGQEMYDGYFKKSPALVRMHAVKALRKQGIWPMA